MSGDTEWGRRDRLTDDRGGSHAADLLLLAAREIDGTTSASLTVRRRRTWITLLATDDVAERADRLQHDLDEGPCLESAETAEWHRSDDVRHDDRWPSWGPRASALGIASVLSVRLVNHQHVVGALNLYSRVPGRYRSRDHVDDALLFATHTALALMDARDAADLTIATDARHVVGMAQGILMVQHGLDQERAFRVLQRHAQDHGIGLNQVAAELVATRRLPDARGSRPGGSRSSS